jgi:hypothetical protein
VQVVLSVSILGVVVIRVNPLEEFRAEICPRYLHTAFKQR